MDLRQAAILKEAADTRDAIVEKAQDKAREEGARLLSDAKAQIETHSTTLPSTDSAATTTADRCRPGTCSRLWASIWDSAISISRKTVSIPIILIICLRMLKTSSISTNR